MIAYRGRIGAILIAALLTSLLPLGFGLLSGELTSRRDVELFLFLAFPFILASALIGIVAVMIPVELLVSRRWPRISSVAVIVANFVLTAIVVFGIARGSDRGADAGMAALLFAIPAALLWLAVDRLYKKAFHHA